MTDDDQPDIDELLRFDPFEQESDDSESAEGAGDAGSEQAEAQTQEQPEDSGQDDGVESEQKPSESGEPAEGEDEKISRLEEQLRQANAAIQEMESKIGQTQEQGQSSASESEQSDEVPSYQFQIPQEIADAVASENTEDRQRGLNMLVDGIGRSVHQRLQEQFRKELEQRVEEVKQTQASQQQNETQADQIRKDYFGQNPDHDSDLIRPVVRSKSQEVMQEWGVRQWTSRVRDEIAKRVNNELRNAGFQKAGQDQQASQQADQQARSTSQDRPPAQRKGNSRPAGSSAGSDIEQTLFG